MPSVAVTKKFSFLTADATAAGVVTISDNTGWHVGASVWIKDANSASVECTIVRRIGTTQLRLRRKDSTAKHGLGSDLSAYTLAQNASLAMEPQTVPVEFAYTPRDAA